MRSSVQLTCRLLHKSGTPSALVKLDIAKAFDTVTWAAGPSCWRSYSSWVSVPYGAIGFRPSCPRRAPKFYSTADRGTASATQEAFGRGIRYRLGSSSWSWKPAARCRASFYADDLVIFVAPAPGDVSVLKELLRIFGYCSSPQFPRREIYSYIIM